MVVHISIALTIYGDIESSMASEQLHHVIEKTASSIDFIGTGAIHFQCQYDLGFLGVSNDLLSTHPVVPPLIFPS